MDVRRTEDRAVRGIGLPLSLAAAGSATVTLVFVALPSLKLGYRAPAVHVALETAAALIALLAAFLVFGRLQREGRVADLVLACGLGVLAVSNFAFYAVPAIAETRPHAEIVWSAIAGRLLGAGFIAAAALASARRLGRPKRAALLAASGAAAILGVTTAVAWALHGQLPLPAAPVVHAATARHPELDVHRSFLVVQMLGALLYLVAAGGFAMRAARRNDGFFRLLALACVVCVFSHVNYFLYPSSYTEWVYLGDAFRLVFFVLLLAAALREIATYWRTATSLATLNERRRLARDLHDGLAQEIAFLRSGVAQVDGPLDDPQLALRLAAAAERAEGESRQLLAALAAPTEATFEILLAETLETVAAREGVTIDHDLAAGVTVDRVRAEALLRIAAEAVTNAARHGCVDVVTVRLEWVGTRLRLLVSDRGRGFDPRLVELDGFTNGHGFGVTSMTRRAAAIGAELSLRSKVGGGTAVEVLV
jgi:signal transduction histidine kinase